LWLAYINAESVDAEDDNDITLRTDDITDTLCVDRKENIAALTRMVECVREDYDTDALQVTTEDFLQYYESRQLRGNGLRR
jgi:hypothetical protein